MRVSPTRTLRRIWGPSLLMRVSLVTALVAAIAVVLLSITPIEIDAPIAGDQFLWVLSGALALLALNLWLLRRVLGPVDRLTTLMTRIDPERPGVRIPESPTHGPEVRALTRAFNQMLDRLEHERRESARLALAAQEAERRRVAQELHDEVGQSLTAAALLIEQLADAGRTEPERLREVAATVRTTLDDVRRIARELRPEALDDLGLVNALIGLTTRASRHQRLHVQRRIDPTPDLSAEQELVIYRVAQESLTNVVRHAKARHVELRLERHDGGVRLRVADDGVGLPDRFPEGSAGVAGMRERARLVGGRLVLREREGGGTLVELTIPVEEDDASPA
jgi:two-component system sensor histidine kinase UhpB